MFNAIMAGLQMCNLSRNFEAIDFFSRKKHISGRIEICTILSVLSNLNYTELTTNMHHIYQLIKLQYLTYLWNLSYKCLCVLLVKLHIYPNLTENCRLIPLKLLLAQCTLIFGIKKKKIGLNKVGGRCCTEGQ